MVAVVTRSPELPTSTTAVQLPHIPASITHHLRPISDRSPHHELPLPNHHLLWACPPRPRRLLGARTHRPTQQRPRIISIDRSPARHRRRSPRVAGGGLRGPRPGRGEIEAHQLERVGGPDRARGRCAQPVSAAGGAVWVLGCAGEEKAVCGLDSGGGSVEAVIVLWTVYYS